VGVSECGLCLKDMLDSEFIESVIDALRRFSNGPDVSLPSWTITK
jgi:abelson tyrosine-protein kinase 1/abelson tyrosine-protein kinase 2